MNAKEAMQALLDGKVLRRGGVTINPTVWGLLIKVDNGTYEEIILEDCEVVEEYPLTFEGALRAMLDGKIVRCKDEVFPGYVYRFHDNRFEDSHEKDYFMKWEPCTILPPAQKSKWKVVG